MAQDCLKFLKYTLFIFNLLFWICGSLILSLGIYLLIDNTYGALLPSFPSLSVANVMIIVGSIIMVVAFQGCMGAIKENKCLLLAFFILLLLILLAEITVAIVVFCYEDKIQSFVENELKDSLKQNNTTDVGRKQAWDTLQKQMKCCGVQNQTDWNKIPKSCCMNETHCSSYWTKGCFSAVIGWFEEHFLLVGIATICVSVIQVLGMSFAMTMYCQISQQTLSLNK
ncbi:leukocyte surface antigen CD53 [Latimeria chalumnae]|uniref:Tetraspanin n=1 Tax=Latimeria chalumnae TaxID=7897 RepID=M3XH92_LATCH|nr:PREDICTED: leukocyte surface antigen CD53 [Latimeria chalumnae]|eukprot:XP_005987647.1 PREDICTED: leukocyte surface antigen CD53 [Latimeria chalumnae]